MHIKSEKAKKIIGKIGEIDKDPILTVTVPSYKAEKFMDKCLISMLKSKYKEKIEILVINDGSTDNTQVIGEYYQKITTNGDRRKAIGLSQDELAHRAGIGRQALSAIENGGDFKTKTLDSLAIVLGVSVDFIMYGENEEKSELLSEAMDVLSDMDELQIRQCLAMMKAMKRVSVEK